MNTTISVIARTARRPVNRLLRRLTRKAEIKLGIIVSLPPFLKLVFFYKADLGEPANDNQPCHKLRHSA